MVTWEETFLLQFHHFDLGLHRTPLSQTDLDKKKKVFHNQEQEEQEQKEEQEQEECSYTGKIYISATVQPQWDRQKLF